MIVLGFDTATAATAVALRLPDGDTLSARDDPGSGQRPGHTTRLLPLARELLERAELPWTALERIAVGIGPGTFTGLRIGVATARGLAQTLGIDVVGVPTPLVLAQSAIAASSVHAPSSASPNADGDGVLAVLDARRGEAFAAAFARRGPGLRELSAPRALAPQELAGLATASDPSLGWQAVGDGAVRFRAQLEAGGIAVAEDDSPLHRVDAGVLCELALTMPPDAPEAVLPDYRRRPDAEIALEIAQQ